MRLTLTCLSALAAFIAAGFWWWSAAQPAPPESPCGRPARGHSAAN